MKNALLFLMGIILFVGCKKDDLTVAPAPPENLTGVVISSSRIDLAWIDRSTNETGFKIERKIQGGTFIVIGSVSANSNTFIDSGLTASTSYIYRVYSYNSGGNSPMYSNEITIITESKIPTINIGGQVWTKINLDVSTYSDGTPIPQVDSMAFRNTTIGAWCYYHNSSANGKVYGKLYNWNAVLGIWNDASKTDLSQRKQLAPEGFHIPSYAELSLLVSNLGGFYVAGGKLKSTGTLLWESPNYGATNESGFTGLPGGALTVTNSISFKYMRQNGIWWSTTDASKVGQSPFNAMVLVLDKGETTGTVNSYDKRSGLSVRCIKD
jgi:uncharacterized protein (TIGR02145 family)